jgi:acyl dehydratase
MPIDIDRVLGAEIPEQRAAWTADDVILYQLGLGAGSPQTDASELSYVYERGLKVLPSYGVIPAQQALVALFATPGFDVSLGRVLHGEQALILHAPLPSEANVVTTARVAGIYDKGKGAVVILETKTADAGGQPLCTNRFSLFVVGEGGFGGDSGPRTPDSSPPERHPDHVVERPILPQQALIYRLSGDKNPLHADPGFAAKAGFDKPILHGLCSYGIACRAAIDTVLDGDVARVAGYSARFAGVVFPGETLGVSLWREDDRVFLTAVSAERGTPVLSNGVLDLRT